jgi:hypothetical protein
MANTTNTSSMYQLQVLVFVQERVQTLGKTLLERGSVCTRVQVYYRKMGPIMSTVYKTKREKNERK